MWLIWCCVRQSERWVKPGEIIVSILRPQNLISPPPPLHTEIFRQDKHRQCQAGHGCMNWYFILFHDQNGTNKPKKNKISSERHNTPYTVDSSQYTLNFSFHTRDLPSSFRKRIYWIYTPVRWQVSQLVGWYFSSYRETEKV